MFICVDCGSSTPVAHLGTKTPLCARCFNKLHARAIAARLGRAAKKAEADA